MEVLALNVRTFCRGCLSVGATFFLLGICAAPADQSLEWQGPDGVTYPDFSGAGIPGGIPKIPSVAEVRVTEAMREGGEDVGTAILEAVHEAEAQGGGAVLLPEGTFRLARPIHIVSSGIVLRGAGRDKTRIQFDYKPGGEEGIRWVTPTPGSPLSTSDMIEVHYDTKRLSKVTLRINGKEVASLGPDSGGGDRFWLLYPVWKNIGNFRPDEENELTVQVDRFDGTQSLKTIQTRLKGTTAPARGALRHPGNTASIAFSGDQASGKLVPQTVLGPVRRGETSVRLAYESSEFAPGDAVVLEAPASKAFLEDIRSLRKDIPRAQALNVAKVEGRVVTFTQPIRLDLANIDEIRLARVEPIRRSGVEDLTLEHLSKQWINGITFQNAWECWMRGVAVVKPGRNPAGFNNSKNCVMVDCSFDDKWFSGGGGTGYLGFGYTWDCLIDQVDASNLRHAPNLQSSASGNVVRRSQFHSSDVNFHMQWAPENLIELCEIDARQGTGSYGYGVFTQKADNTMHGPGGGPRNVIWGNRFVSPKAGVYLGGSNRGWIFAYNRFEVAKGPGVIQRYGSIDHVFLGNQFVIEDGESPGFLFEDGDHEGSRYENNFVIGSSKLAEGSGSDIVKAVSNHLLPKEASVPTIGLPFASLYEAQVATRNQAPKILPNPTLSSDL